MQEVLQSNLSIEVTRYVIVNVYFCNGFKICLGGELKFVHPVSGLARSAHSSHAYVLHWSVILDITTPFLP